MTVATKREVVRMVLEGKCPPYIPWSIGFTKEAGDKLRPTMAVRISKGR